MESKHMLGQSATCFNVNRLYVMVTESLPVILVLYKVTLTNNYIKINPSLLTAVKSHREDSPTHQNSWSCWAKARAQSSTYINQYSFIHFKMRCINSLQRNTNRTRFSYSLTSKSQLKAILIGLTHYFYSLASAWYFILEGKKPA